MAPTFRKMTFATLKAMRAVVENELCRVYSLDDVEAEFRGNESRRRVEAADRGRGRTKWMRVSN